MPEAPPRSHPRGTLQRMPCLQGPARASFMSWKDHSRLLQAELGTKSLVQREVGVVSKKGCRRKVAASAWGRLGWNRALA